MPTCPRTILFPYTTLFRSTATAVVSFKDSFGDTVSVTRSTDSTHGSSGAATKEFVDANISISPNGINEVNHSHTFTITTTAIPDGRTVTGFKITPSINPTP